jgi:5-methylcytosine-specific restriction endonuclease McrA
MTKEEIQKLKQNPARYKRHLKACRKYGKRRTERNRVERLKRRSNSPYWQVKGHHRYKRHKFCLMAKYTNQRCKNGKITALDLWSIAKKQKLICPLTGEKLTIKNISVDHIIPISKGGTNNPSNIQLVTHHANTVKNNMNLTELFKFCQTVVQRLSPSGG